MSERTIKINELILQQLGGIINRVVEMPEIFLTILKVTTSADLKYATVYVGVMPDDKADYAVHKLNLLSKRLQGELNKKVVLKSIPRLEFRLDKGVAVAEAAESIDNLLDKIKQEISE
jgi:ribosome-binding factor A